MKIKDLKKVYPTAIESTMSSPNPALFNYYDGFKYLHIYKDTMNESEQKILTLLMQPEESRSVWYQYLIQDSNILPEIDGDFMTIHFHVKNLNEQQDAWLTSFESFFPGARDTFFVDREYGVLIADQYNQNMDQLYGFISMLDDDFSTTTTLFIGMMCSVHVLRDVFNEERILFSKNIKSERVIQYIDAYVPYYIAPSLSESIIAQEIKQKLGHDDELIALISSLWKHQGNISATADELFTHRNTINYRIDKVSKDTGLNLRNMQQLLLCYLLTL
ncbi:helix-turn-helix domain-containing protein [Erysipelothrix urinaevulpis]|uniref:helix-turn-helix domain-containing protein n=1 Tax=Erysipelothrix urinaevulpis TaxID=2683717 RepID=UPI00135B8581|nr:helix-turn-helix domain-containing protein [Erysipelothrix urinaevulpis]